MLLDDGFGPLIAEVSAMRAHLSIRAREKVAIDTRHHLELRRHDIPLSPDLPIRALVRSPLL